MGTTIAFTAGAVAGKGRGATLGSPTVNLDLSQVPAELREGVYAVRCNGLPAVMHYGPRPTLELGKSCEVHMLDRQKLAIKEPLKNASSGAAIRKSLRFATVGACPERSRGEPSLRVFQRFLNELIDRKNGDRVTAVEVIERLRDVQDFGSEEALKKQIAEDVERAKQILGMQESEPITPLPPITYNL